jgi:hypothetical protein
MGPAVATPFSRCRETSCCGSSGYANECTPTDPCPTPTPVVPDALTFDYINMRWEADGKCYKIYLGGSDLGVGPIITSSETPVDCPS